MQNSVVTMQLECTQRCTGKPWLYCWSRSWAWDLWIQIFWRIILCPLTCILFYNAVVFKWEDCPILRPIYAWNCIILYPPNNSLTTQYNIERTNTIECDTMPCINLSEYWTILLNAVYNLIKINIPAGKRDSNFKTICMLPVWVMFSKSIFCFET